MIDDAHDDEQLRGPTIRVEIERVDRRIIEQARTLSASTLHEASGRIGALPAAIKPLSKRRICGPAITVDSPGGDNLWLHRALYIALPGDVLVVQVAGAFDFGYWGEIMSVAAASRRLGGLVINGCVRDSEQLAQSEFPIFARGVCIRGTAKDYGARGWINFPVLMEGVTISPGDLIVGDADGCVALPRVRSAQIVADAVTREIAEADIMRRLQAGARTLDIYNFSSRSTPTASAGTAHDH